MPRKFKNPTPCFAGPSGFLTQIPEFCISTGQFPAKRFVLQQLEHICDAGQPGKRRVGVGSKEDVSRQQLRPVFDGLAGDGFTADAGRSDGLHALYPLIHIAGNGRFRPRPAKEAAIAPQPFHHTASHSATESANRNFIALRSSCRRRAASMNAIERRPAGLSCNSIKYPPPDYTIRLLLCHQICHTVFFAIQFYFSAI